MALNAANRVQFISLMDCKLAPRPIASARLVYRAVRHCHGSKLITKRPHSQGSFQLDIPLTPAAGIIRNSRCRQRLPNMTVSASSETDSCSSRPKVGFLGQGTMGVPMAKNLLAAGYDVTVWNRSTDKCKTAADAGAHVAETPKQVVESCDITFAMLADPAAALEVATGPDGAAAGMSAGKGYVDSSTIDVGTVQQIAAAIREAGGQYLEAPVSGSKAPAENGQLIFLSAGDKELFDASAPMLDVMGKRSFFLGEVGQGAKMKLVINMIMGSMMVSFAEGLALAKDTGLSQQDLIDAMGIGAIAAPMYAMKGPSMTQGNYPPAFPLKHQQKDLRLVLELADSISQPLPVAAAANQSYLKAMEEGLGDMDFSAVLDAVVRGTQ